MYCLKYLLCFKSNCMTNLNDFSSLYVHDRLNCLFRVYRYINYYLYKLVISFGGLTKHIRWNLLLWWVNKNAPQSTSLPKEDCWIHPFGPVMSPGEGVVSPLPAVETGKARLYWVLCRDWIQANPFYLFVSIKVCTPVCLVLFY